MNKAEVKTGQSIDSVKENLLSPRLTEEILNLPSIEKNKRVNIIDIGAGDASYTKHVANNLIDQKIAVENLALIEADTKIFPELLSNAIAPDLHPAINLQIVETKTQSIIQEFLNQYEGQYDVAISQLVLHQIINDSEMSYLIYLIYETLKNDGDFFLIDLDPAFIQFLAKNEPDKFKAYEKDGVLEGEYHFDSGGSIKTKNRKIPILLTTILSLGFDFVSVEQIKPDAIAAKKDRYQKMSEEEVPMFFMMRLKKNENNFVSSTKGVIKKIESHSEADLSITFTDKKEIIIPKFKNWENVQPKDHLALLETHRREIDARILNCWITHSDKHPEAGKISHDQMFFRVKNV